MLDRMMANGQCVQDKMLTATEIAEAFARKGADLIERKSMLRYKPQ